MDLSLLSSFLPETSAKPTVLWLEYCLHSKYISSGHVNVIS